MANKTKAVILSLIVIIVILAAIMIYAFAVQPAIMNRQNIVYNAGYNTAQVDFINGMLTQANKNNGFVYIPVSENQTLVFQYWSPEMLQQLQQTPAQ